MFNKKFDNQIENILKKYYYKDDKINIFDKNAASKFRLNSNLYLVSLLKEVLYHELFNSKYKKCNNSIITNFDENTTKIEKLIEVVRTSDSKKTLELIRDLVPEYFIPNYQNDSV